MAIVSLSGLISDIRGSVSGSTFQQSGAGLTMRKKPLPIGQSTNRQYLIRARQGQLNRAWLTLSDEQRLAWTAFSNYVNGIGKSSKGNSTTNAGKVHFITVNFKLLSYGKSIVTDPVFDVPEKTFIPCPPDYNVSSNLMNTSESLDTSTQVLVTKVSAPQSLATYTNNTGFRLLTYNQQNGYQQDWAAAYEETWGVPLKFNYKYWISYQAVNFMKGTQGPETRQLVFYREATGIGVWVIGSTFTIT